MRETLQPLDAQMSKMSPEQRQAMASLNEEAKKRIAERAAFDAAKENEMTVPHETEVEVTTPFKEAHGKDIAVPAIPEDFGEVGKGPRYATAEEEKRAAIERAHAQGGPKATYAGEGTKILEHLIDTLAENRGVNTDLRYTQSTLAEEFERIFEQELMALRNAGQKEYAHDDDSPFANFERGAKDAGIDRKQILWIYAMKHKDGIAGYLQGHTSQREDVRGRINDLIVYLLLLRGMINEEVGSSGIMGLGDLEK